MPEASKPRSETIVNYELLWFYCSFKGFLALTETYWLKYRKEKTLNNFLPSVLTIQVSNCVAFFFFFFPTEGCLMVNLAICVVVLSFVKTFIK